MVARDGDEEEGGGVVSPEAVDFVIGAEEVEGEGASEPSLRSEGHMGTPCGEINVL